MKCIIFSNGDYGTDLSIYRSIIANSDLIICADGGANYAWEMGITPYCIIGDMDSIDAAVKDFYEKESIPIRKYSRKKDFTDTQLALAIAEEAKANEIVFVGSLGKRLDHTLSNLYCCIEAAQRGVSIKHFSPNLTIHLVTETIDLVGKTGDLVSILSLTDSSNCVSESGLDFSLDNVCLTKDNPYAISNLMGREHVTINVGQGVLAVFHYW